MPRDCTKGRARLCNDRRTNHWCRFLKPSQHENTSAHHVCVSTAIYTNATSPSRYGAEVWTLTQDFNCLDAELALKNIISFASGFQDVYWKLCYHHDVTVQFVYAYIRFPKVIIYALVMKVYVRLGRLCRAAEARFVTTISFDYFWRQK